MHEKLRILLIEDNPDDARLIKETLNEADVRNELTWVSGLAACKDEPGLADFDVILLDLGLPDSRDLSSLARLNEMYPAAPVIVLTGHADEATGIEAVAKGAQDYLLKSELNPGMLKRVIRYSLERRKSMAELAKSEAFNRSILESVGEGFCIIDRDYNIISANRAYCEQFKLAASDIIGRRCYEVSHHLDRPCHLAGEQCGPYHTFRTGQPHDALHTHHDRDGKTIYVETKSFPLRNAAGITHAVIETLADTTEKRNLEEQLRHAQKMESIGTLAGGIAHDFNNLLTVIAGFGDILHATMAEGTRDKENVEQILIAANRAAQLTRGLLTFSRKQVLEIKLVNVNEIVRGMQKMLMRIVGEDIEINWHLTFADLFIKADWGKIEQVLMNLVANAHDAMPAGGRLTVESSIVSVGEDEHYKTLLIPSGGYAQITVADTGTGMSAETLSKIFDPYFTTKEIGKGTGLGMAIVYGIVKQHKGEILCESTPGKGTTLRVLFPLAEGAEAVQQAEMADIDLVGTATILLADDDPAVRRYLQRILTGKGYTVIEAVDGEDAVVKFKNYAEPIHLLILDLVMPRKTGLEAYREILENAPDIGILFISGYPFDTLQQKGMMKKNTEVLAKPFRAHDLLAAVRDELDRDRGAVVSQLATSTTKPLVFFIDDEPGILKAVERITGEEPYEVVTYLDPREALADLDRNEAAVVVTDQRMPGMSGTELLEEVRRKRPNATRILLTGGGEPEAITAIGQGRIFRVITKPWLEGELRAAITEAITYYLTRATRPPLELASAC